MEILDRQTRDDYCLDSSKPLRELSIEEILTWTFDIYSKNFVTFLMLFIVAGLISGILSLPILDYITRMAENLGPHITWNQLWNYILSLIAMVIILAIVSWMVSIIITGISVKYTSDTIEKGKATLAEAFNNTLYKLPSLLIATLISGILIALGLLALIIPGIILYIMFYLVIPVIVIEDVGAFNGLSRSRRLVSNRWLKTVVLILIISIIISVVALIVNFLATPFGYTSLLLSNIVTAFVEPISPIALTIYYYSMLAKEQQRIPPPPPPF